MKEYIQTHYGVCRAMQETGKCECLYKRLDQEACKDYEPVKAETWEQLAEYVKQMETKSETR